MNGHYGKRVEMMQSVVRSNSVFLTNDGLHNHFIKYLQDIGNSIPIRSTSKRLTSHESHIDILKWGLK